MTVLDYPAIDVSRLDLREGNCKKPIYAMHKWWARRLGTVFRMLLVTEGLRTADECPPIWEGFYSKNELPQHFTVLDPFLGGGTSLVEAAKLGAQCVGVDNDPVACFVTQMELTPVSPEKILDSFREIERNVAPTIKKLYRSKVDGEMVDVVYNFWVDHITCPDCDTGSDGHPTYQLAYDTAAGTQTLVCPHCGGLATRRLSAKSYTCSSCGARTDLTAPPVFAGRYTCFQCGAERPIHSLYRSGAVVPRMFAFEFLRSNGARGFAPVVAWFQNPAALLDCENSPWVVTDSDLCVSRVADETPFCTET